MHAQGRKRDHRNKRGVRPEVKCHSKENKEVWKDLLSSTGLRSISPHIKLEGNTIQTSDLFKVVKTKDLL